MINRKKKELKLYIKISRLYIIIIQNGNELKNARTGYKTRSVCMQMNK